MKTIPTCVIQFIYDIDVIYVNLMNKIQQVKPKQIRNQLKFSQKLNAADFNENVRIKCFKKENI